MERIKYTVECLPEDEPVRGNAMLSGDADVDKECEDKILADLEWNQWAWCCVEVTAEWRGLKERVYLGCSSYANEEDFKKDQYESMCAEAREGLLKRVRDIIDAAAELQAIEEAVTP